MKSNAYNMQVMVLSLSRTQNHLNLSLKSLKIWVLFSVYQEQSLNLPKTVYSIWVIIKHTMEGETTLKGVNNKMSWFIGHTKTQLQICSSRSEQIRINDLGATEPPIARIEYQYLQVIHANFKHWFTDFESKLKTINKSFIGVEIYIK